jgi:uncharacterized protein
MRIFYFFVLLLFWGEVSASTEKIPIPEFNLNQPVIDAANILTPNQHQYITHQLSELTRQADIEMAVFITPTIGNDSIETFSNRVFNIWKLGDKEKNNGLLFLIATNDHTVRIEVGYGLEGKMTDVQAGRIIRSIVIPEFKNNNYFNGIKLAIDDLSLILNVPIVSSTNNIGDHFDNQRYINNTLPRLIIWIVGVILLPNIIFRKRTLFIRSMKCSAVIVVGFVCADFLSGGQIVDINLYLLEFILCVFIFVFLFIIVSSITGKQFEGVFKKNSNNTKSNNRSGNNRFSHRSGGSGGSSGGGGASGSW